MGIAEMEILAPVIFGIIITLTIGGVILLKPISNKLGSLLEAMAKERNEPGAVEEMARLRELLETMNGRLSLLEERQDFTDALLADPERRRPRPAAQIPAGSEDGE